MAERKSVNKYYPPDWDPSKGSINAYVGQHPLRDRARKLDQGILIIRFEMPFNIWCEGCGEMIATGIRFNAEKKKIGNYYSTPVYSFRMKCRFCGNWIEIHTDPKNSKYTVIEGAKKKTEEEDGEGEEKRKLHEEKKRRMTDAIFELERKKKDEEKKKRDEERIQQLMMDNNNKWENSGRMNSILRDKFRTKKKEREAKQAENDKIINKYRLGVTQLQEPSEEDNVQAKKVRLDRLSSKDNRKLNELKKAAAISTEEEKGKSAASRHLRKLAAQKHNFFT